MAFENRPFRINEAAARFSMQPNPETQVYDPTERYDSSTEGVPSFEVTVARRFRQPSIRRLLIDRTQMTYPNSTDCASMHFIHFSLNVDIQGNVIGINPHETIELWINPFDYFSSDFYLLDYEISEARPTFAQLEKVTLMRAISSTSDTGLEWVGNKTLWSTDTKSSLYYREALRLPGVHEEFDWLKAARMYAEGIFQLPNRDGIPLTAELISEHPLGI